MNFIKTHIKLVIGIAALLLVVFVLIFGMRSTNLESGDLRSWASSSSERRIAAAKILTGTDENSEIMVSCIDRISLMPDASKMKVKDAASLCAVGIFLKNNN